MSKTAPPLILLSLLITLSAPPSYAQTDCGNVTPTAGTAINCASTTGAAALNISGGVPDFVVDNPVVTVNSTTAVATFTSYDANVATTQTGGDTVVIGGATAATFRTDDESYTTKSGSDGNVATITAGTGDVNVDIHNISRVKIEGTGGNGIIATSASGSVNVNLSTGGLLLSDQSGTNGLIANTTSGSIDLTLADENTFIHMITYRAKRDELSDTRGATLTSTSGAITVEITDSAAIIASSLGASYGLAADTGGSAGIDITVANSTACIVGKDGIIANTVSGNIDLALANGIVYGRGGKGSTPTGGNGIIATSTSGDINISGKDGSVLYADGVGSIAIEASTTGILSVVAEEAGGLSVWTEGGFAAINGGTVDVVGADVWGNSSNYAILATGDVDVRGADVWTNKTGATTISANYANVRKKSQVRATGTSATTISATTVVVLGSEVWTEGNTSNTIVAETANVLNEGKVWSNAVGSSAISAKDSGGVTVVSEDGKGEIWSNAVGSSTVKATTAANIHGAKVWANGGTSSAVTAETVLVNNTKVWANGAASNTVVAETVNILNEGKVWASGGRSSAVASGDSGNVAVVSGDGKGQVWTTVNGVSTVNATGTAEINNLNVWANGQSSKAVKAATAEINGAQVWTTANSGRTIDATDVTIWNGAKVWANGLEASAVKAGDSGTVNITSGDGTGEIWTSGHFSRTVFANTAIVRDAHVWTNGWGSNAISTTLNGTATVSNSAVWVDGGMLSIAISTPLGTVTVSNNSQVWSNGWQSKSIVTLGGTANVSNSRVWSKGFGGTAIIAQNVDIEGSDVWTERDHSTAVLISSGISSVNNSNLTAYGSGKVFVLDASGGDTELNLHSSTIGFEGASGEFFKITETDSGKVTVGSRNSSFWMGENGATVFSTTIDESGTVTDRIDELERTDRIVISDINRVWTKGKKGTVFSLDHKGTGDEVVKISKYFNAQQAWTEGQRSNTIRIKTENGHVLFNTSGKVWANGSRSSAISVETGSGNVSIIGTDMWTKLQRSNTVHIKTGTGDVSFVTTGKVSAKGPRSSAISVETGGENVFIIGAEIKAEKNYSNAVHIKTGTEDVSFIIGGKIWANKKNSSAVFAESGGGNISIETDSIIDTRIWTEMHNSNTVRIKTGTGDVSFNTGGTIWAEGENSSAVFAESNGGTVSLSSPDGEIWTEGNFSTTVFANTAVTVRGLKIWTSGKESNAIVAQNVSINGSDVWTEKNDSFVVTVNSGNSSVNNSNFTVGNEGGAAFVLGANGGDITLDLHNSTIGFNEGSSGQFFKVSNTGNETVSVESLNSSFWMGGDGATVFSTIVEADGAVKNRLGGFELADSIVISDINRVWAKGTNSSAFFFNHQKAADDDEEVKISDYFNAKQAWTEGDNSNTIRIKTKTANVSFISSGNIWANGANSSAIIAQTDTGDANIEIGANHSVWTNGVNSVAVTAEATGAGNASVYTRAGARIFTNAADSVAVLIQADDKIRVSLEQGSVVYTEEAESIAMKLSLSASLTLDGSTRVLANGVNSSTIVFARHIPRNQSRSSRADSSAGSGGAEVNIGNGAVVCAGVLSGSTCTPGAGSYAVRFEADDGATGDTKITIGTGSSVTGAVLLSENRDVVYNNGSFTGSGTTGDGDDTVENRGTFTLTGDFDMGDGSDVFENLEGGMVVYGGGQSAQSSAGFRVRHGETESAHSTPSSGGEGRFRLSASSPASAPHSTGTPTINFGGGEDTFINNGTMVIEEAGRFDGLDKISFGENSTLVVSADPEEMADRPLIDIEGEITASDIEGFRVKVGVPGTHVTEYTIFEADDLPEGEERQEVVERLNAGMGERGSVQTDGDGNLFLTAMSLKDASLDIYDSLIQSAYRADRSFATKLSSGCGYGSAASDEIAGDFWTGCVWATSGGRYTRYSSAINYDEDVYTFTGGVSAPFNSILVSVAGGYEISTLDMDVLTDEGRADASGEATRFMGGIFASTIVDRYMVDGRFQYVSTSWESTRSDGDNRYSADTNATVFGGALGAAMPFLSGSFALFPRIEIGASYVTAGAFDETSLTDTEEARADAFKVKDTSEILVYVSPSFEARSPLSETVNMRIRVGADIHILNPEAELEATLDGGNVPRSGGQDRIMFNYGAGFEYTPYAPLRELSVRIDYDGGMSASFDTFVQEFRGGVNYSF